MAHRLRYPVNEGRLSALMTGTVEMDETYIGGRKNGTPRGRPGPDSHKTPVVALVDRGTGRARAIPMPRHVGELSAMLNAHAEPSAELMTDDFYAYRSVGERQQRHGVVKHSAKQYVNGPDHTNAIEELCSLLRRGINGAVQSRLSVASVSTSGRRISPRIGRLPMSLVKV